MLEVLQTSAKVFVSAEAGAAGVITSSDPGLLAGVWYFIATWHDGSTLFLQINNGIIDSNAGSGSGSPVGSFDLGAIGDGNSPLNGMLDSVMIWDRFLSQPERSEVWNGGQGISCASIFPATVPVTDYPVFEKAIVLRSFKKVKLGQAVTISVNIKDILTSPGQRISASSFVLPQIQLYNPDGTVKVSFVNMNWTDAGFYIYQHQTLNTDMAGLYSVRFRAVNITSTALTDKLVAFTAVSS